MIQMTIALSRMGHPSLGIIIPAIILVLSVVTTIWLYRHFTR